MIQQLTSSILLVAILCLVGARCKSLTTDDAVSAVIPSPNQDFGDEGSYSNEADIQRTGAVADVQQQSASNEAVVPVYVSPFARSERSAGKPLNFEHQESSHAPPNYAPRPVASSSNVAPSDLKTSASYGHHHHGGHHGGYDHSGWLDMGAWTGGKGSFGWYADYPVGGKHGHYGYGRR